MMHLPEAKAPRTRNGAANSNSASHKRELRSSGPIGMDSLRTRARQSPDESWTEVRSSSVVRRSRVPSSTGVGRLPPGASASTASAQLQQSPSRVSAAAAGPTRARSVGAPLGQQSSSELAQPARTSQRARSAAPEPKAVPNYNPEVGSMRANAGGGFKSYSGNAPNNARPVYQEPFLLAEGSCDFPSLPGQSGGNAVSKTAEDVSIASNLPRSFTSPAEGNKHQGAVHRLPSRCSMLEAVFKALDANLNGRLNSDELLQFARLTGFDGDDATWREEYNLLCTEHGVHPPDGLNRKAFAELVDASSEKGCPCDDSELHLISQKLLAAETKISSKPAKLAAGERTPALLPRGAASNKSRVDDASKVAMNLGENTIEEGSSAPKKLQAQSDIVGNKSQGVAAQGSSQEIPIGTSSSAAHGRGRSAQTRIKDAAKVQPSLQKLPPNRSSQERPDGNVEHRPATNRFGKQRQRAPLIKSIFAALDLDGDGLLCNEEMRRFADLSGFDGSDEEWSTEFRLLSEEWNLESKDGIEDVVFADMVNDSTNSGCYCTDQELLAIRRKLLSVKAKPNMQSKAEEDPIAPEVATAPSLPDRPSPMEVASPVDEPHVSEGCRKAVHVHNVESFEEAASANIGVAPPSASSRVTDCPEVSGESTPAATSCDSKPETMLASRVPSRLVAKTVSGSREKAWLPQLRPASAQPMELLTTTAAPQHRKPAEEDRTKNFKVTQKQTVVYQHDGFNDDDEWEDTPPEAPAKQHEKDMCDAQLEASTEKPTSDDEHQQEAESYGEESAELYMNTCADCGETWLLPLDFGEQFLCEDAGKLCGAAASKAAAATFSLGAAIPKHAEAETDEDPEGLSSSSLRARLLKRVLCEGLTGVDCASIFFNKGQEPPKAAELEAFRAELQRRSAERAADRKQEAAREQERMRRKKQQRYLNGQLVDVQKGSKYLVEPKESNEDRQKTSCSIAIIGARGHNTVKSEKTGPRS